jgi:hypothetical protein
MTCLLKCGIESGHFFFVTAIRETQVLRECRAFADAIAEIRYKK